jgi:tetratricopeptide (TPR) repeat protein
MSSASGASARADAFFKQGLTHHQAGRLAEAEQAYQQALKLNPHHADSLHLWGVIAAQTGQPQIAVERISKAIEGNAKADSYHCNLGLSLANLGRFDEAEAAYRRALAINPGSYEALNNLGLTLRDNHRLDEAAQVFHKAIEIASHSPEGHNNLGLTLMDLGKMGEAEQSFQHAIALRQDYAEAHYNLGNLYRSASLWEPAASCYHNALVARPNHAQARNNLGLVLLELNRAAEAVAHLDAAARLRPGHVATLCNLGSALIAAGRAAEAEPILKAAVERAPDSALAQDNLGTALKDLKRLDEAEACYLRAMALEPASAEHVNNLGSVRHEQGRADEAVALFRQAAALNPAYPNSHYNLATLHHERYELDEAAGHYARALAAKPDYAEARSNLSMLQLTLGQWDEGWRNYEYRWRTREGARFHRPMPMPQWLGEEAVGKSLLVHAEQGFGDSLQFCRYTVEAGRRGLKVTLAVDKALLRLMRGLPDIAAVVEMSGQIPMTDLHCPMLSLPLALGGETPAIADRHPYLAPLPQDCETWRRRIEALAGDGLKVGLVWAGNPRLHMPLASAVDKRRSMSVQQMAPLIRSPNIQGAGCRFFSLQKDGPDAPEDLGVINLMSHAQDFADTAAFIANLDLVISVDTAVAHLAAAIGKPVWLLERFDSCWRWLKDREDTPWYPTMRLFRQGAPGDWPGVVARVTARLEDMTRP